MSDPALALQEAIEAALRADDAFKAACDGDDYVRVYTMSAPVGAQTPYTLIGEDQVIDDSTECADSSEVITTLHHYARVDHEVSESRLQAKRMAAASRAVLKRDFVVPGFDVVLQEFETTRHLTDPDGLTAHSVVSHRFLLDPA